MEMPGRLVLTSALMWVVSAVLINLLWAGLGILCLIVTMPIGAAPFIYVRMKRRALSIISEGTAGRLDLMVSALVAGHSLIGALGLSRPTRRNRFGVSFGFASRNKISASICIPRWTIFAAAYRSRMCASSLPPFYLERKRRKSG